ncbi:hypothetical protein [Aliarcobacter butzleri]|uniref:hypothetical protein n=1 Tax=Aliarcobacter butzleri TaxID=28197 RepID=UPI0012613089|nr:hypothetical protein [Aliarcobacter butzleri]
MAKSKRLQTNNNSAEITIEDSLERNKTQTAIFNQQNNFHLSQNIDIGKLTQLSEKNPELANRIMSLYEKQQQHNINIDNKIIVIEEKEQDLRIKEIPFQRKFAFRVLNFAVILSIISLVAAAGFAYLGHTKLAATAIIIPITVTVANMLNRNNKKKTNK